MTRLAFRFASTRGAADVVVALDHLRLGSDALARLDEVGVQGPLHEEGVGGDAEADEFPLLDGHEEVTYDAPLGFGFFHSCEGREEIVLSLDHVEVAGSELSEVLHDLRALRLPHEPRVDVHQMDPGRIEDGQEEGPRHRGVDAAGYQEEDIALPHPRADQSPLRIDVRAHAPAAFRAADSLDEVAQYPRSLLAVAHFGVELHAPDAVLPVDDGRGDAPLAQREDLETVGGLVYRVAVAHPAGKRAFHLREERVRRGRWQEADEFASVFPLGETANRAPALEGQSLGSIADAEDRHPRREYRGMDGRGFRLVGAAGRAREDDSDAIRHVDREACA